MSLSKQECINSIDILDLMTCCYCDEVECEKCPYYTGSDIYCKADEAINMLYELIYEYFELIEENKHLQSQSSKYQEALDIYSHLEDEGTVSDYTPLEYQVDSVHCHYCGQKLR